MVKVHGFTIFVALASAGGVLLLPVAAPEGMQTATLVTGTLPLKFLCIWTLGSLPIAFAMPRLRAGFFGRMRRAPSGTYILPRWIVRFCIGAMFGQVAGFLMLAILHDHHIFWLVGSLGLVCGAFCAGAWPRLKKRPRTEFAIRWWPRI